jgi:hypothetical protein
LKCVQASVSLLTTSLILLGILIICPPFSHAFYEWESDDRYFDLRGFLRVFGAAYRNPEDDFFYDDKRESGLAGIGRLILQGQSGDRFGFEFNAFQTYIPESLVSNQTSLDTPQGVERSAALETSCSDDDFVRLAVDRLNARWTYDRLDLTVGRQPINLATTFYFTPNDFFAPFAAQTFFRVFKLGVDAARAEVRLGDLSQLSLITVLGFEPDPGSDTGWSDNPDGDRTSYLGRISTVFHDMEWALLGGNVRETDVIGGSIQGELFQWLGIRAEGHYANPDDSDGDDFSEIVLGLEHRWENSFNLRLEQFYHGSGSDSVRDYTRVPVSAQERILYLAEHYTAVDANYEFTPLLTGEVLGIANWVDHSYLLSLNALYSLADEAELSVSLGIPIGDDPQGPDIKSEFGLYPHSIIIEIRSFF